MLKNMLAILLSTLILYQGAASLGVIAAFQLNQDYILEFLCINKYERIPLCEGSCYLKISLEENSGSQAPAESPAQQKLEVLSYIIPQGLAETAGQGDLANACLADRYNRWLPSGSRTAVFHPPC